MITVLSLPIKLALFLGYATSFEHIVTHHVPSYIEIENVSQKCNLCTHLSYQCLTSDPFTDNQFISILNRSCNVDACKSDKQ